LSARYTSIPLVALPSAPPTTRATSEGSGLDVPQVPTAASLAAKPRGNNLNYRAPLSTNVILLIASTLTCTYHQVLQDSDAQSSLCNSMFSLSVSSNPSNPVPSSPSATPGRGQKYYVVSVGKCSGVFDNWFALYFFLSRLTHDSFLPV
jgi:hypothetical protein